MIVHLPQADGSSSSIWISAAAVTDVVYKNTSQRQAAAVATVRKDSSQSSTADVAAVCWDTRPTLSAASASCKDMFWPCAAAAIPLVTMPCYCCLLRGCARDCTQAYQYITMVTGQEISHSLVWLSLLLYARRYHSHALPLVLRASIPCDHLLVLLSSAETLDSLSCAATAVCKDTS